MADTSELKKKVDELACRVWDDEAIKARVKKLTEKGIPKKKLVPEELKVDKDKIFDRVQLRAEEYNYIFKNCAQGTAMGLLEEFGLGNMEIIKALTPFPGIGGTGEICGGITGSLIAFGLYFGSDDRLDYSAMNRTIAISQKFMAQFERTVGCRYCSDIIESVIIGRKLNPGESDKSMAAFAGAKGFEKCGLLPGTGARLAAGFIIDSLNDAASAVGGKKEPVEVITGRLELAGKMVSVDEQGFMQDFSGWSEDIAQAYAAREGVHKLTEKHWKVIKYLRDYYQANQTCPKIRALEKVTGFTLKQLYDLFPEGPANHACKWAGIPKAAGCS